MDDPASGVFAILAFLVGLFLAFWLCVLLPADMAKNRNRSALIWVLISLFGSPILAILLLLALWDRPPGGPGS